MIEFLIELISQIAGEIVVDYLADRAAWDGWNSTPIAVIGHGVVGAVLGAATLPFLPHHVIASSSVRAAALVAVPAGLGAAFAALEARRAPGTNSRPVHRFLTTAALALGFGAVRFLFAG